MTPTVRSVLEALTRERLFDLGRSTGTRLRAGRDGKREAVVALSRTLGEERLPEVLRELGRDELRAVCRQHGLAHDEPHREALVRRLLGAAGVEAEPPRPRPRAAPDGVPQRGQVLAARGRQWLVEGSEPGEAGASALLALACLDDDAPGRRLQMLWELELGARVVDPEAQGLPEPRRLDAPELFGAYLHALAWSAVSAADPTRFQAPFRAGIKLMAHQLTPLMKALELPRANLFIADDVGLGKTIEAGLVLQELVLRQQAEFVLIVCPASVSLQWRDEMMRRFGLRFAVMSRAFVARRRQERGYGVNPWSTHHRFIVSFPLVRRPEYRDPLLALLGERAEKGLLIVDEAHVVAPASASRYAVDSATTRTVRDLAPKFDNRLFLSATPHNGHTNSFRALLEILDPIRFGRGTAPLGPEELAPVMVRRLKRDLRRLGVERFPERVLCRLELVHGAGGWSVTEERQSAEEDRSEPPTELASGLGGEASELRLGELLGRYTELCAPAQGRGRLVFVNLQKRLLSSPEAFATTLDAHARAVERAGGVRVQPVQPAMDLEPDTETYGEDDEAREAEENADVAAASAALPSPTEEATVLLRQMRGLAERARRVPDGKTRALVAWLRAHLCPALGLGPDTGAERSWSDRRVILFTEYAATKRYLLGLLRAAIAHTDQAEERIAVLHGGMGDETRDAVQRAFNTPPDRDPVRILVATDAAREGVNLQAHCADLFHVDVPWNPSRMEQRNGRIDRTLQPAPEVRCHYFVYAGRREDHVLDTLVRKIRTVQRELGSAGAVLMDEMERRLAGGLDERAAAALERLGRDERTGTAAAVLTPDDDDLAALQADIHRAGRLLDSSQRALEVEPGALRGVVETGLRLAGAAGLRPGPETAGGRASYLLPELDDSWAATLDVLRPPRGRDESFWDWRRRPPRAVTFAPLVTLTEDAEQLHLAHPLVRRILDRFVAQGFGAHDLSRVCAVVVPGENVARVVGYARLTLFGPGAVRLHDELVAVAAAWTPGEPVTPYKDAATAARARAVTERALATGGAAPSATVAAQALAHASAVYADLWPQLDAEADARAAAARTGLARRARKESEELRELIRRQQKAAERDEDDLRQRTLADVRDRSQRRQVELDLAAVADRRARLARDLEDEPAKIEALYVVQMTRLVPVGLVVAWPEAMT